MRKIRVISSLLASIFLVACSQQALKASVPGNVLPNFQYHGMYIFGAEVNEVTLCGLEPTYWVLVNQSVDEKLQRVYQFLTSEPYEAIYIRFNGSLLEKASDGFAADYDGQIAIDELVEAYSEEQKSCP